MTKAPEVETAARMTPEEIMDQIHALAKQNDDPAGKRWALGKLNAGETGGISLREPANHEEIVERVARQIRGLSHKEARRAWGKAFPGDVPQAWVMAKQRGVARVAMNVRELIQMFPEVELDKYGMPKGYPTGGTELSRKRWVADLSVKLMKKQERAQEIKDEHAARETPEQTDLVP